MKKKVTIIDIGKAAGFSKATVSKVLRNEPYVKKSTREKILNIIKEIGYHPDEIARSLVTGKTINFIGLILADITNPFFAEVALGVENAAKKINCNVILCNTNYNQSEEKEYIDILLRNRAQGIILTTPNIDDANIRYLLNINYPFVLITRRVKGLKTNIVTIDHFKASKQAVNYLIKKGHKKIAHFTGKDKNFGVIKREEGYKASLIENNLEVDKKLIFRSAVSLDGGYESAERMLKIKERPSAIFTIDDLIAIGAMECFKDNGYRIPEDFSVVGYDNINIAGLKAINLTTVNQPKFDLGVKSVEILSEQIKSGPDYKPVICYLESNIVERGSVLDINGK